MVSLLPRPIRFGAALRPTESPDDWRAKARLAETLGYDIIYRSDLPGMPSPLPALAAAAFATERIRVGSAVLNVGFWHPELLARELATIDQLTAGRLEIGLGSGETQISTPDSPLIKLPPGDRFARLVRAIEAIRAISARTNGSPQFLQWPHPPLMIAGVGDRLLRYAVKNADTINLGLSPRNPRAALPVAPPLVDAATALERTSFVQSAALENDGRAIELSLPILQVIVTEDRVAAAERLHATSAPYLSVEEILESPKALIGTIPSMAQQLRERRERYGFSHYIIPEPFMHDIAEVMALLREDDTVKGNEHDARAWNRLAGNTNR
jgi:probable F420-dependent oxidoreductase